MQARIIELLIYNCERFFPDKVKCIVFPALQLLALLNLGFNRVLFKMCKRNGIENYISAGFFFN